MTTAFQRTAFQDNAFQIEPALREVRWPGTTVKKKKKKEGPDIGLMLELQRQAKEAADQIQRQREADRPVEVVEAEAPAAPSMAARRLVKGLIELPSENIIKVDAAANPKAAKKEISARLEEEELVLLMMLAQ